ncbi:hypothetical protein SMC26_08460 [Actinomadura fulvescens]|uniref:hypothetical protein n=1 Tax=Actinomadura fulvescens TaxID=46160 RepID=UPI0031D0A1B1
MGSRGALFAQRGAELGEPVHGVGRLADLDCFDGSFAEADALLDAADLDQGQPDAGQHAAGLLLRRIAREQSRRKAYRVTAGCGDGRPR